jgi:hypothetical protein
VFVMRRDDERGEYRAYRPMTPTIVSLDHVGETERGRATLRVERSGSLPIEYLRPIMDSLGFGVVQPTAANGAAATGAAAVLAA